MSLQDTNDKLQSARVHLSRTGEHTVLGPTETVPDQSLLSPFEQEGKWQAPPKSGASPLMPTTPEVMFVDISGKRRRRIIAAVFGIIALGMLAVGIVIKVRTMFFNEENITTSFSGPSSVPSAETVTFAFSYTNSNWASLENAVLVLTFPDSFHPEAQDGVKINGSLAEFPIGRIAARTDGKILVPGTFYGMQGQEIGRAHV